MFIYEIRNDITKYFFYHKSSMSKSQVKCHLKKNKMYNESITYKNLLDNGLTYVKTLMEDTNREFISNRFNELLTAQYNNTFCVNYNKNNYVEPEELEQKSNSEPIKNVEVYSKWLSIADMKDKAYIIKEKTNQDNLFKSSMSVYKTMYSMDGEFFKQCVFLLNIQLEYKETEDGVPYISDRCKEQLYKRFSEHLEINENGSKYICWFKVYFDTLSSQIKTNSTLL